jgi:hypothetical protein
MLKVNSDPNCPGVGETGPDDASLTNYGPTVHELTTNNPRLKFSMASIPKARWEEIFGPKPGDKPWLTFRHDAKA